LKDLDLKLDINYHMTQEVSEAGKKRYQEFLEQMDNLKNFDANSYVENLEK
jgi:hypothetical protein